jgi:hypothetical protein
MTCETVETDTPARRATSAIVGMAAQIECWQALLPDDAFPVSSYGLLPFS